MATSADKARHLTRACSAARSIGIMVWMSLAKPEGVTAFGLGVVEGEARLSNGGREWDDGARCWRAVGSRESADGTRGRNAGAPLGMRAF